MKFVIVRLLPARYFNTGRFNLLKRISGSHKAVSWWCGMAGKSRAGRKKNQSFILLQRHIYNSPEFLRLSPKAVKLLIDVWAQYNGFNNGDLCATWSIMEKRGWNSRGTLATALKELEFAGWLERTRQGGRNKCNLYALSLFNIDDWVIPPNNN